MPVCNVFFFALFLVFCAVSQSFGQEAVAEPLYQNGDCWTFKILSENWVGATTRDISDGEYRICFANTTLVSIQDGKRSRVSNFWSFAFPLKERDTLKYLDKFPLVVGQKWSHEYESVLLGTSRRVKRTAEIQVVGWESVTTPAGTFDCVKIERGVWSGGQQTERIIYHWSPRSKSSVKYKREAFVDPNVRYIDLISYELKRR